MDINCLKIVYKRWFRIYKMFLEIIFKLIIVKFICFFWVLFVLFLLCIINLYLDLINFGLIFYLLLKVRNRRRCNREVKIRW